MVMLICLRRIYNFLLFHANIIQFLYTFGNFYMIYCTNLLIQCPVSAPIFCMFFVLPKIHIKRSPNAIKIYGELFWNLCDFWEVSKQTGAHSAHNPPGHALLSCALLERRLELYFGRKEDYIRKKIM